MAITSANIGIPTSSLRVPTYSLGIPMFLWTLYHKMDISLLFKIYKFDGVRNWFNLVVSFPEHIIYWDINISRSYLYI